MISEAAEVTGYKVRFEYRFDRDTVKHNEALAIRRDLASRYARKYQQNFVGVCKVIGVELYPVARAGNSGSEVFYLDVLFHERELPSHFVAKFQSVKDSEREYKCSQEAKIAQMCTEVAIELDAVNDVGMIVCELTRVQNHCEYRTYFLNLQNSDESCAQALSSILKRVAKRPNALGVKKSFIEDYGWYIDRKNQPLERLNSIILAGNDNKSLSLLAQNVKDHYEKIANEFNHIVRPYLVHGDLHARNLMVNSFDANETELIDFGWVHEGHPAKDFVLMEATIKYQLFKELLQSKRVEKKDNQHISAESFKKIERYMCIKGMDFPDFDEYSSSQGLAEEFRPDQVEALRRVYTCVSQIRLQANFALEEYKSAGEVDHYTIKQHYYASLFLVVLGLSAMPEMDVIWTLLALKEIGDHIWISEI